MRSSCLILDEQYASQWTRVHKYAAGERAPSGLIDAAQLVLPYHGHAPRVSEPIRNPRRIHINAQVQLNFGISPTLAILGSDINRGLLILQNSSTATSPDTAPNFYFSFGIQAQTIGGLNLIPGVGLVLDDAVPVDQVFLTVGTYSNGGGSTLIQGYAASGQLVRDNPFGFGERMREDAESDDGGRY